MPLPDAQHEVFDADGVLVARLDGAYPLDRLGLEFDGATIHDQPGALYHDRFRQNRLIELGWVTLRFTWWDVTRDPRRFAAAVRNMLARRAGEQRRAN